MEEIQILQKAVAESLEAKESLKSELQRKKLEYEDFTSRLNEANNLRIAEIKARDETTLKMAMLQSSKNDSLQKKNLKIHFSNIHCFIFIYYRAILSLYTKNSRRYISSGVI